MGPLAASQASSRWAAVVLICQKDFVKVHRDSDFIVGKIPQPGPFRLDGVGQKRHNFGQRDGHGGLSGGILRDLEGGRIALRAVIDSQMTRVHGILPIRFIHPPCMVSDLSCIGRRCLADLIYLEENAVFAKLIYWNGAMRQADLSRNAGLSGNLDNVWLIG